MAGHIALPYIAMTGCVVSPVVLPLTTKSRAQVHRHMMKLHVCSLERRDQTPGSFMKQNQFNKYAKLYDVSFCVSYSNVKVGLHDILKNLRQGCDDLDMHVPATYLTYQSYLSPTLLAV